MANYSNYLLQKAKMKHDIAMAKPEKPRFGDEVSLNKALFDMQQQTSAPERQIDEQMYNELSENWKSGGGGSRGDALISGLKAGLKKGSLLDNKKRMEKFMGGVEKLKAMVENTNREIYKQEKTFNAQQSIMPRLMSFMKTQKNMDPNAKRVFLQNTLDEYNQAAETNYKLLSYDGTEPWKVTLSDNGESQFLDLMSLMKTPEQIKYEMYVENAPEMQQAEKLMQTEDALDTRNKKATAELHEAQMQRTQTLNNQQQGAQQKREQLQQSGVLPTGALMFDEIQEPAELKARIEDLKTEKEKLLPTEAGIKALKEMDAIFKKHPKISTSLAKWANSKEDTLSANFFKNIVNQDERDALLQLEKHAATLGLGTIQQFKGQRPTDILKKLIQDTNPGSNFTYEAFVPIKDQYMQLFEAQKAKSLEAAKGWSKRYFPSYENLYQNQEPSSILAKEPAAGETSDVLVEDPATGEQMWLSPEDAEIAIGRGGRKVQ